MSPLNCLWNEIFYCSISKNLPSYLPSSTYQVTLQFFCYLLRFRDISVYNVKCTLITSHRMSWHRKLDMCILTELNILRGCAWLCWCSNETKFPEVVLGDNQGHTKPFVLPHSAWIRDVMSMYCENKLKYFEASKRKTVK